jgi:predicted exporter
VALPAEASLRRRWRVAGALWLALVVAAATWCAVVWGVQRRGFDTDLLALLPRDAQDPVAQHAIDRMAAANRQDVVALVGARDWTIARRAADAYVAVLDSARDDLRPEPSLAEAGDPRASPFWRWYRDGLLTSDDRARLGGAPTAALVQLGLRELASPMAGARIGAWSDDPFGFFQRWWLARASSTPVRPYDGVLRVDRGDSSYVVIANELTASAFSFGVQQRVIPRLAAARAAARRVAPDVHVVQAGFVFPAAAASAQASGEFNTIGIGSLLGIALVMWLTFRSWRPITLVAVSLAVGTVVAMAVTALVYERVHLLTLVFGASLLGVAEDYGTHVLGISDRHARGVHRTIVASLHGLSLALGTTIVSFAALASGPFPGLRQIALFSVVGLAAAWLTVVLWFPALDGPQVGNPRAIARFDALRSWWRARAGAGLARVVLAGAALALVAGLARLRSDDDIRRLQTLPGDVIAEQVEAARILRLPVPGQFFVVRGASTDDVLAREERLRERLDSLVTTGALRGYQAVSAWVPSRERYEADRRLVLHRLRGDGGGLDALGLAIGEGRGWGRRLAMRRWAADAPYPPDGRPSRNTFGYEPEVVVREAIPAPLRTLWLGRMGDEHASVITLVEPRDDALATIAAAARGLDGVRWVDEARAISTLLGDYRARMSLVLLASYALVTLLLCWRVGRRGWRLVAPSVIASLTALGALGLAGEPLQVFHVLALFLVFGIGIDFAIFSTEDAGHRDDDVWFAVGLAGASTILSLGLLALSGTPALRAFGIVMSIGVTVSLFVTPLVCRPARADA